MGNLKSLQKQLSNFKQVSTEFWKPKAGKNTIRIVPIKTNPDVPSIEVKRYYKTLNDKVIISPEVRGEKDPVVEFCNSLWNTGNDLEKQMIPLLRPKTRHYMYIIDRNQEDKGVQIWEVAGKGNGNVPDQIAEFILNTDYMKLPEELEDKTIDEILELDPDLDTLKVLFHPLEGNDLVVTHTPPNPSIKGDFGKTMVIPSTKKTPLTKDKEKMKEWLNNQPSMFGSAEMPTYEQMKKYLGNWLNTNSKNGKNTEEDEVDEVEETKTPVKKVEEKAKKIETAKNEFESMFGEDDE